MCTSRTTMCMYIIVYRRHKNCGNLKLNFDSLIIF